MKTTPRDDDLRAVVHRCVFHLERDDRMRLRSVRAGDDRDIILVNLVRGVAHRAGTERELQCDDAAGVAEARAVIDIVRADDRAELFCSA